MDKLWVMWPAINSEFSFLSPHFLKACESLFNPRTGLAGLAASAAALCCPCAQAEFNISLNFSATTTTEQKAVFTAAANYWMSEISGYKAGITLSGITINADVTAIDGAGGILGQAGPDGFALQQGTFYATSGIMQFDSADVNSLISAGTFDEVIRHEIGHILGIGTLWEDNNLYVAGTGKYTGSGALAGWRYEFGLPGDLFVPVELGGGPGTRNGHWNESDGGWDTGIASRITGRDLSEELMTGWAGADMFTGLITLGSLKDLGYTLAVPTDAQGNYLLESGPIIGDLTGARSLQKVSTGTVILLGDNTFSGGAILEAGRVVTQNSHALGTGQVIIRGAILDVADCNLIGLSKLTLESGLITGTTGSLTASAYELQSGTLSAQLTGSAAVTKTTNGTVSVTAAQSYTGGTVIEAGRLLAGHARALSTGPVTINGGTLDVDTTAVTGAGTVTLNTGLITGSGGSLSAAAFDLRAGTVTASLAGSGALTKTTAGTVTLSGNNSFSGGLSVEAGLLVATAKGSLGAGNVVITGGGITVTHTDAAERATLLVNGGAISFSTLTEARVGAIVGDAALALSNDSGQALTLTVGTNGASTSYAGVLSGSGSLTKDGAGTFTLAGANTYTGGTSVAGGKLVLANANALGAGPLAIRGGTLDLNALDIASPTTVTIESGTIIGAAGGSLSAPGFALKGGNVAVELTGTGALTKTGTGIATLAAANTYTGGTTVAEGTLRIVAATALSSGTVSIAGGTLDVAGTSVTAPGGVTLYSGSIIGTTGSLSAASFELQSGIVSATITGPAGLEKTTIGTVTLAAANSFKGDVNIRAGTLAITHAAALGGGRNLVSPGATLQVGDNTALPAEWAGTPIANEGTVDLRLSSDTTVTRTITGAGNLVQNGTGTVLLANPTYTGSTTVNAGTLVIPTSVIPSGPLAARSEGTLEFRSDAALVDFSRAVSGDGTVAFSGTGTTRLIGAYSHSGRLLVKSGASVSLGASSADSVTVASRLLSIEKGARLSGSGAIAGSMYNAGTLAPGFSPGTITLGGDFINTGTLEMQVAADGTHDEIRYAGQAFLGGALVVSYINGAPAKGTTFSFFTDTNTSDGKPSVIGGLASLSLPSGGGVFYATASGLSFISGGTLLDIPGVSIIGRNRLADFARALGEAASASPSLASTLSAISTPTSLIGNLVFNASPLGLAAATALPVAQASADAELLGRHLNARRFERPYGPLSEPSPYAYGKGMISTADTSSDGIAFDYRSFGGVVGMDIDHDKQLMLGVQIAYDNATADFHQGGGKLDQNHARVTVYASHLFNGRYFVDVGAFGGGSLYDSSRNTILGKNTGNTTGWEAGGLINSGFVLVMSNGLTLTPRAGLTFTHAAVSGFTESGNALALDIGDYEQNSLASRVGCTINYSTKLGDHAVRFSLGAEWVHEWLDTDTTIGGRISGAGFTTKAAATPADRLEVGPEIDFAIDDAMSITASYKFDYAFGDTIGHRFDIGFRLRL